MAKKKVVHAPEEVTPNEDVHKVYPLTPDEVFAQEPPQGEPAPDTSPQHIPDKTYSYMVADAKGVLRRHSFKESQATEDDIMHFVKRLENVYNDAPLYAKMNFMAYAFPPMRRFLREYEPEILAAIMHEPETNPN